MKIHFLLVIFSALLLAGCDRSEPEVNSPPRQVKVFTVDETHRLDSRVFPARVLAGDDTTLSFKRAGQLQQLNIREGAKVKAGDILAQLNASDASLRVKERQSAFNLAQRQFERFSTLAQRHVVSRAELDVQRANRDSASAALKIAQEELQYLTLRAPFDGVIARLNVRNHQVVAAGQAIATLSSLQSLDVVFNVPESLFTSLDVRNVNYRPRVRINNLPDREFIASYKEHATNTDSGTLTYQITLTMPRPADLPVVGGMSGTVSINLGNLPTAAQASAMVVPVEAVFNPDKSQLNQAHVWVIKEENGALRVEDRVVKVGQITSQGIEITAGLQPGDRIVSAGVGELRAQQPVRIWTRERGL
ncbi:RND family efflux transporter MFP subunit [Gibbsiella quercinecans]|uniref:Efflux transporter periplasmic adaptor subunit n=1 Tax=Gibbsiella quercinecans TaxID=929813 RepID=A0A250B8B6_9GAMM|nr:efflux RND transporter periplasmic adaptor subunit [Gibbsiella quercinecans]ATA22480.1 efflux transporter periplasmic adaptor subunit [Gibbsiella quercinecans]RLM02274.1 efflux transporter periplasmic adaptor subunit [Gibbsiella quercinecans]RLM10857.1 efflux transporter periplasmic adaptor subunit [Gibbsiella quercinecans]TCT89211.1 RND family efflux transporter MFP subunit [Gibbsiella quercinecans]